MTEAEFIESLNLHAGNSIEGYALFISLTFAYLTVAYFAGDKLSIPQVLIVSVLYITSAVVFSLVSLVHIESFEALVAGYPDFINSNWWFFPWSLVAPSLAIGGIIASAYFMWDVRHEKSE